MSTPDQFGSIAFTLTEEHRQVSFATTLASDRCADYVAAFRSALLSFGFAPLTVESYFPIEGGE